jgi:hypothetical protein
VVLQVGIPGNEAVACRVARHAFVTVCVVDGSRQKTKW